MAFGPVIGRAVRSCYNGFHFGTADVTCLWIDQTTQATVDAPPDGPPLPEASMPRSGLGIDINGPMLKLEGPRRLPSCRLVVG